MWVLGHFLEHVWIYFLSATKSYGLRPRIIDNSVRNWQSLFSKRK